MKRTTPIGDFLALAAGALLPLAFAPFSWFLLAILSPTILFVLWQDHSPQRCFWRGWLYGLGFFGVGISWVYISFHDFGNMHWLVAGLLTALFVMFLALYPALLGWFSSRFFAYAHYSKFLLILPAGWVLLEWIRSWLLTGFPWLSLGYSQIDSPLRGFAPLLGVYGVSLAVILTAGLLAHMIKANHWKLEEATLSLLIFLGVWGGGSWAADRVWYQLPENGESLQVALIQGNIPQEFKWEAEQQQATIERYLSLSQQYRTADLIVWPETAISSFLHFGTTQQLLKILMQERALYQTDFLVGIPYMDQQTRRYYNSVLSLSEQPQLYYKHHLVPFGEYVPFSDWFGGLLDLLAVPMSAFSAGEAYQPNLMAANYPVGVSICYEAAFGQRVRSALPKAQLLVNVSNDAWFGDSIAPHQHLEIARLRALENARYLLRATNTGISAVIAPNGQIVTQSAQFATTGISATVQPLQGATPYVRLGELPILLIISAILLLGGLIHQQMQRQLRQQIV